MFGEIIDNSVDESFTGIATEVWVQIHEDGSAEVRDQRPRYSN